MDYYHLFQAIILIKSKSICLFIINEKAVVENYVPETSSRKWKAGAGTKMAQNANLMSTLITFP